jgi:hypothetical protein
MISLEAVHATVAASAQLAACLQAIRTPAPGKTAVLLLDVSAY